MMLGSLLVNEVRIRLDDIKNLSVFKCAIPKISTNHRERIVNLLLKEQKRVSIFEGEILFSFPVDHENLENDRHLLVSLISKQKIDLNYKQISYISLREVPERVIERITYALISFQAMSQGIFPLFDRIFFRPTLDTKKIAHKAVEISTYIEDGFIKFYLDPTFIALSNINETVREDKQDLELVDLCSYRNMNLCSFAQNDGSCRFQTPGKLGYFVEERSIDSFEKDQHEFFINKYKGCPNISEQLSIVFAKTTKKATNTTPYPSFLVCSRLSKADLYSSPETKKHYRDATLIKSEERIGTTREWIKSIFLIDNTDIQRWGIIQANRIEIPVEIVLSVNHSNEPTSPQGIYKTIFIPDQKVTNDSKNPFPQNLSGGWLFANKGSFDRRDLSRPFSTIRPYLIVPKDEETVNLSRQIIAYLSDDRYISRTKKGDHDFAGINLPESKAKYNSTFINPFTEEEGLYLIENSQQGYQTAVKDIIRDWNVNSDKKNNGHAIVIIPGDNENCDNLYYYQIKKMLVEIGIPSTFITINTLQKLNNPEIAFGPILESIWQNIYAKMGGKPWRLANTLGNVHCFIGVGFGINPGVTENHIYAGIAHVFDNYGSWIDIASDSTDLSNSELTSFEGPEKFSQGSASFKISQSVSQSIVYDALKLYQEKQTKNHLNATNIVLHKLGPIYDCEVIGFLEGISHVLGSLGNCRLGLLQIEQEHHIRLYGSSLEAKVINNTVFRGSAIQMNSNKMILASTGRSYRQTSSGLSTKYYGIGTPQPLLLKSIVPSQQILQKYGCTLDQFYDIEELSKHVMALTQLHWGSLRDNVRLPITVLYAKKVADLLSKTDLKINPSLGIYRPWFL